MIPIDLAGVIATARLESDQAELAKAPDADGPGLVSVRGSDGWRGLKPQLWKAQQNKCAYCEDYLREVVDEVDHIRPRDANKYWWLAFSLPNLLLACRTCNNFKNNKFDLQAGVTRLVPRQVPWLVAEPGLLIDPTIEDPAADITYVYEHGRWRIAPANDSPRGAWTIEKLKLDRMSFDREANLFIADVVGPLVTRFNTAIAARDRDDIRAVTIALTTLTKTGARWTQLMRIVVAAIQEGSYPPDPQSS